MSDNNDKVQLSDKVSSNIKIYNIKAIIIAIILIAISLISYIIIIRNNKYNAALVKLEDKEYDVAYTLLSELGGSKANNIIKESKYERATQLLKNNDDISALILYNEILDYKDSQEKKDEILKGKEYLKMFVSKEGDEITFGKYEQDNNTSNGKEDLEWIIIYNNNKRIYMVSKYIIDAMQYNTANGDGSTLKKWLMVNFVNETFKDNEMELISHVGLLNRNDMKQYNKIINATPSWTNYSMAQKPTKGYSGGYSWWLDGEYFHGFATTEVLMDVVVESGEYSNHASSITEKNGIRPAIIIDINDNDIDYYADDYDDIENSGIVTRTKADVDKEVSDILGTKTTSNSASNSKKCNRCAGTGKVVLHYGKSWNQKEGYKYGEKCGACGGTGYIK